MMDTKTRSLSFTSKDFIQELFTHKKIPENGWNSMAVEYLLSHLSSMDSNNFTSKASVGEREGRCFSELVARRNYHFSHGIGRSGDLTEPQPKAIGSSILYKLTNALLNDFMTIYELNLNCLLVPVPLGICLILCLNTLRLERKSSEYVLWFREDNKGIINAIVNAGFTLIVINSANNMILLKEKIEEIGVDNINCVISSSSCVFPRDSDNMEEICEICNNYQLPHIINNDCGLQSKDIMMKIKKAHEKGRIDLILQNAGTNFMIPVGSTLIASSQTDIIENVAKIYPGRASSSSVIDILITLLSLGIKGYKKVLDNRENSLQYFYERLVKMSEVYKSIITAVSYTCMSVALSLYDDVADFTSINELRTRNIDTYFVTKLEDQVLSKYKFEDWECHGSNCSVPFIVFTLSLGTSQEEVNYNLEKLEMYFSSLNSNKIKPL